MEFSIFNDRQSKDLGSNPSAVESVFFSTERFSNSLNIEYNFFKLKKNIYTSYEQMLRVKFVDFCSNIYIYIYVVESKFFQTMILQFYDWMKNPRKVSVVSIYVVKNSLL